MTHLPPRIRPVARHDVVVSRYLYEDGSLSVKVSGPRIPGATPEDTMEFLVNGVAMIARVVGKYRDDLGREQVQEMVIDCIEEAFKNNAYDGFSIVWPRDDNPPPDFGQPAKP